MKFTEIQELLDAELVTVPGLPTLQTENTRFKLVNGVPWCRSTLLPAETNIVTLGTTGYDELNGLLQVDLFFPGDTGYATASALADAVMAVFTKGKQLPGATINVEIEKSWRLSARTFDTFYSIPVLVSWRGYVFP